MSPYTEKKTEQSNTPRDDLRGRTLTETRVLLLHTERATNCTSAVWLCLSIRATAFAVLYERVPLTGAPGGRFGIPVDVNESVRRTFDLVRIQHNS